MICCWRRLSLLATSTKLWRHLSSLYPPCFRSSAEIAFLTPSPAFSSHIAFLTPRRPTTKYCGTPCVTVLERRVTLDIRQGDLLWADECYGVSVQRYTGRLPICSTYRSSRSCRPSDRKYLKDMFSIIFSYSQYVFLKYDQKSPEGT